MTHDDDNSWTLKYRTKDGQGLWCITYEERPLWQLAPAMHPPSAHGGYRSKEIVLKIHGLDESKLIEATA